MFAFLTDGDVGGRWIMLCSEHDFDLRLSVGV